MHSTLGLGLRHSLHAMHAAFVLQLGVGALPVDLESDLVVAADSGRRSIDHLHLPSFPLRPSRVHAKEICGEQRSLVAALRALDLNDDFASAIRFFGQKHPFRLLSDLGTLPARAAPLGPLYPLLSRAFPFP